MNSLKQTIVVDQLFDDLVDIGLNCFNPFQPELRDVY